MKFATVLHETSTRVAIVKDGEPTVLLSPEFQDVGSLVVALAAGSPDPYRAFQVCAADAPIIAPVPRPKRNIFCIGKNYHEHAQEFASSGFDTSAVSGGDAVPSAPIVFSKVPESVIAPKSAIVFDDRVSNAIDYEGELAVIIGRQGRQIRREDALTHVWGYTIVNDVTARDIQQRLRQWLVGKSFDTFCPMGPWAVSADEVDVTNLCLRTWVNGELRQDGNTREFIFDIPTIIETISAGVTLYPGDIIATGTPAGVGIGFKPPKYLKDGDHVVISIDGLGKLENHVRVERPARR